MGFPGWDFVADDCGSVEMMGIFAFMTMMMMRGRLVVRFGIGVRDEMCGLEMRG